jgi:hypothetical protein
MVSAFTTKPKVVEEKFTGFGVSPEELAEAEAKKKREEAEAARRAEEARIAALPTNSGNYGPPELPFINMNTAPVSAPVIAPVIAPIAPPAPSLAQQAEAARAKFIRAIESSDATEEAKEKAKLALAEKSDALILETYELALKSDVA